MGALESTLGRFLPPAAMARLGPLVAGRGTVLGLAAAALGLALLGMLVLWSWGSSYAVLFAGLSGEEGGLTLAELQKLNIPYRITEGGRVILVPSGDVGRARLQLAAHGIPKSGGDEWAVLDNESLGVSPFVEQVHYQRGIESALARTIGEVDGVLSAKVSLAMPKDTDFLGDSPKPSASVLVRVQPGVELTASQVDGIAGLVASSVPDLTRDRVTIVDQTGRALTGNGQEGLQGVPQQLALAREITHRYEASVTDLLAPVLGRGNFRVSADADIDFSRSKESLVKYGDSHVLSQDVTTHTRSGDADQTMGIPGALSNRRPDTPVTGAPPQTQPATPQATGAIGQGTAPETAKPAAAQPPVAADSHKTVNYDIDRTVQYREQPAWTMRSISIAVLVNNASGKPLPATRIDAVRTLVTSAIGAEQNPHVTVVDLPFAAVEPGVSVPAGSWWAAPWMAAVERNAVFALAGMLALFGGLLPLLRWVAPLAAPAPAAARAASGGAPRAAAAAAGRPVDLPEPTERALGATQDVFSIEAETVQTLVDNDPARTAQVIRGWISGDRNSLKQAS